MDSQVLHNKDISINKAKPLVSVIIPTYNRALFIEQAINSILSQTFKNFEIIVVDDGSTDATKNIIAKIKDRRLQYIYQTNKGRSNARNNALKIARGKYITFLDSDDLYLKDKLQIQVDFFEANSDVYMIYTSAYCIDDHGLLLNHRYEATLSGWLYENIAFFIPITITLPTVMLRREVFDKVGYFDEALHRFEDLDMWRRVSKSYQIFAISQYTCRLRTHLENSLLSQDPKYISQALGDYANKVITEDKEFDLNLRKAGLAKMYIYYGSSMMSTTKFYYIGKKLMSIAHILNPELGIDNWPIARCTRVIYNKLAKLGRFLYKYKLLRWLDFQLYKFLKLLLSLLRDLSHKLKNGNH